ncbi:MAG: hypothetical protein NC093_11255 [Alistipes sp.]|nr:hypothetical protein [Alistipes sp.]
MPDTERRMWRINIENAAAEVCGIYGSDVAQSVFRRYDASGFDDLSSCYYAEVFGDLELMANDN